MLLAVFDEEDDTGEEVPINSIPAVGMVNVDGILKCPCGGAPKAPVWGECPSVSGGKGDGFIGTGTAGAV